MYKFKTKIDEEIFNRLPLSEEAKEEFIKLLIKKQEEEEKQESLSDKNEKK